MKHLAAALLAGLTTLLALPAVAGDGIAVSDAYVRALGAGAPSGALYFRIDNPGDHADRLTEVTTDAATRAELHANVRDARGMVEMIALPDGIVIPAGGNVTLAPGGDHVMLFGLTRPLAEGDIVSVTLRFERAGEIGIAAVVDNGRKPGNAAAMDHQGMGHDATGHD